MLDSDLGEKTASFYANEIQKENERFILFNVIQRF